MYSKISVFAGAILALDSNAVSSYYQPSQYYPQPVSSGHGTYYPPAGHAPVSYPHPDPTHSHPQYVHQPQAKMLYIPYKPGYGARPVAPYPETQGYHYYPHPYNPYSASSTTYYPAKANVTASCIDGTNLNMQLSQSAGQDTQVRGISGTFVDT